LREATHHDHKSGETWPRFERLPKC
jgi:hypothetical protein